MTTLNDIYWHKYSHCVFFLVLVCFPQRFRERQHAWNLQPWRKSKWNHVCTENGSRVTSVKWWKEISRWLKYHKISYHHSGFRTDKKLEGNWQRFCLVSLVLDSSKVAISRGVFDWYFVRGPTGDAWFQKCCNHERSGVPFGFFRKMQIMRLPTRIFQTDLKQAEAKLMQGVFPKHFRTAQIAKRTKWLRSFGIMAPCGGLWG